MNAIQLSMLIIIYAILSAFVVNSGESVEAIDLPTLDLPTFDFIDISGGCGSFTDCTEYLANVVYNIGLGIIAVVQTLFALIAFVVEFSVVIVGLSVSGISNAPVWLNTVVGGYLGISMGIIIFRMARKGDSTA